MTLTEFLLARIAEDKANLAALREMKVWESECQPIGLRRFEAECEAKRMMLELHGPHGQGPHRLPCRELAAIALPYADHPDYREEWRP